MARDCSRAALSVRTVVNGRDFTPLLHGVKHFILLTPPSVTATSASKSPGPMPPLTLN
jgi:hypothetical protein